MLAIVQRVSAASVEVPGRNYRAEIGMGLLILLGIEKGDAEADAAWLAEKCAVLRIFEDAGGKMNCSLQDVKGSALVVSQFTLAGDCHKGRRPGFDKAAPPELAEPLYEKFCELLEINHQIPVQRGIFRSTMKVSLVNEGPVTFIVRQSASAQA